MTHKPIRCACGRKFAQVEHWEAHRQSFHKGKAVEFTTKPRVDDDEPSMADRSIDAMLDHAMGIPNDDYDWLVEPFQ